MQALEQTLSILTCSEEEAVERAHALCQDWDSHELDVDFPDAGAPPEEDMQELVQAFLAECVLFVFFSLAFSASLRARRKKKKNSKTTPRRQFRLTEELLELAAEEEARAARCT